jgi:hypothetical protein
MELQNLLTIATVLATIIHTATPQARLPDIYRMQS